MKHLTAVAILFLCVQIPVHANTPKTKESQSIPKATEKLVLDMQKNYQAINSYHALWQAEGKEGQMDGKLELEAAFDRKTGKTLFSMLGYQKNDGKWTATGWEIHVYDGKKIQRAASLFKGQPIQQVEEIIDDPNNFTYRNFRKNIFLIHPFDLPLLYPDYAMTMYPLMEMLQGSPEEVRVIKSDPNDPEKMPAIEIMTYETCARIHLDPKTLLIKDFVFFSKDSGKFVQPKFKRTMISINKPFKPDFFDFKERLKTFDFAAPRKLPHKTP